eukprot:Nk52_evm1s183 gene=Nk52_evmTU1s183
MTIININSSDNPQHMEEQGQEDSPQVLKLLKQQQQHDSTKTNSPGNNDIHPQARFQFHEMDTVKLRSFHAPSSEIKDCFLKWDLQDTIRAHKFCFDAHFKEYEIDQLLVDFFNDPNVRARLQVLTRSNSWSPISGSRVEAVKREDISATVMDLSFFDRLTEESSIVRSNGTIVKCFDEYLDGMYSQITVSDELRKMFLLPEESEFTDLFSSEDQREFCYRLLKHFQIGGVLCQYEDEFKPYLDTVKTVYKELISVVKDSGATEASADSNNNKKSPNLVVVSRVYNVLRLIPEGERKAKREAEEEQRAGGHVGDAQKLQSQRNAATASGGGVLSSLYPVDGCDADSDQHHFQNFCYLIVDPIKRQINVLYNAWRGF